MSLELLLGVQSLCGWDIISNLDFCSCSLSQNLVGCSSATTFFFFFLLVLSVLQCRHSDSRKSSEQVCLSRKWKRCTLVEKKDTSEHFLRWSRRHDKHQGSGYGGVQGGGGGQTSDKRMDAIRGTWRNPSLPFLPSVALIYFPLLVLFGGGGAFVWGTQHESSLTTRERQVDSGGREMNSPAYRQRCGGV